MRLALGKNIIWQICGIANKIFWDLSVTTQLKRETNKSKNILQWDNLTFVKYTQNKQRITSIISEKESERERERQTRSVKRLY